MSPAESLRVWGILRAVEVVELAAAARLDVAAAATLLEKESYGGRNVWGSDGVPTGGTYVKGAEVTREAYAAYRARRVELGAQGVGPCQLTWPGYQDQADALGGCWDWRHNVTVGFGTLAGLIRSHGLRDGFRRYNGSGPAAERYADDAVAKVAKWRDRLGAVRPSPTPRPPVEDDMTPDQARMLQVVYDQLTGNNFTGWPAWQGGTEETLTAVDYLRRGNVETREVLRKLAALARRLDELTGLVRAAGVDPEAVRDALTAALDGGITFTGTATAVPASTSTEEVPQ